MARVVITIDDKNTEENAVDIETHFFSDYDPATATPAQKLAMQMIEYVENTAYKFDSHWEE